MQAVAEKLPFRTGSFDTAMAILTIHHWPDAIRGLQELRRTSRKQLVLMNEPSIGRRFWLLDYFPQARQLETETSAPTISDIGRVLDIRSVEVVPVPADCIDGFAAAYWNRPQAYLDPSVRAGMSLLAQLPPAAVDAGVKHLRDDLDNGAWEANHGHLRHQNQHDYGYRLIHTQNADSGASSVLLWWGSG